MSGSQDSKAEDGIRTFICIEIPESVKERIAELQRHLRQIDSRVSWTKPSNIHLTLKFLGDVAPSRIERVRQAAERSVISIDSFRDRSRRRGMFPFPALPARLVGRISHAPGFAQAVAQKAGRGAFSRRVPPRIEAILSSPDDRARPRPAQQLSAGRGVAGARV